MATENTEGKEKGAPCLVQLSITAPMDEHVCGRAGRATAHRPAGTGSLNPSSSVFSVANLPVDEDSAP